MTIVPQRLPTTLVFDLDGTLADTAADLIETLNVLLAREQVAPVPVERARDVVRLPLEQDPQPRVRVAQT